MAVELHVEGFEALMELLKSDEKCKTADRLFVLFCGSVGADGNSWCPDCVVAEPLVASTLKEIDCAGLVLVHCSVGNKEFWKNQSNVFRTDKKLKLTSVPTLMDWNHPEKRLGDDTCTKKAMVKLLLEGED